MATTDILIGLFTIVIAGLGTVAWYFIDAWIRSVDETLKSQAETLEETKEKIGAIPKYSPNDLASYVADDIRKRKLFPVHKLDEIQKDVVLIKDTLSTKVLPKIDRMEELNGKIILIEERVNDQDGKIVSIINHLTQKKRQK